MKCPDTGTLQAYLDGELEIELKKQIEIHLSSCINCSKRFSELKENDDFSFETLKNYKQLIDENIEPPLNSIKVNSTLTVPDKKFKSNKGVENFMVKYKKIVVAACAIGLITTCLTVQPIRAAVSNALSVFRVENIKGLKITLNDITEIQNKLAQRKGQISIDSFGDITMSGGKTNNLSADQLKAYADVTLIAPSDSGELTPKIQEIQEIEPSKIDFKLKVDNVNDILKTLGASKFFPAQVDGKTFSVSFARQISIKYSIGNKIYELKQTKQPEISVPSDVDVDELYNSLVEMPIIPEDLQKQLKSIKDWKKTLYIPVVDSNMEEVNINGNTAYVYSDSTTSWLLFTKNDTIFSLISTTDKNDLIKIAKSLR